MQDFTPVVVHPNPKVCQSRIRCLAKLQIFSIGAIRVLIFLNHQNYDYYTRVSCKFDMRNTLSCLYSSKYDNTGICNETSPTVRFKYIYNFQFFRNYISTITRFIEHSGIDVKSNKLTYYDDCLYNS